MQKIFLPHSHLKAKVELRVQVAKKAVASVVTRSNNGLE